MTLNLTFGGSLRIPLIAVPMFLVSSPEMALAACSRGVMGSFSAHSTRTREVFADWLDQMTRRRPMPSTSSSTAPSSATPATSSCASSTRVSVILTSKGAPEDAFRQIHNYGGVAFHDIVSRRHAGGIDAIDGPFDTTNSA